MIIEPKQLQQGRSKPFQIHGRNSQDYGTFVCREDLQPSCNDPQQVQFGQKAFNICTLEKEF